MTEPSIATAEPPTLARLRGLRSTITALAERYGARNIRVFGSVARGDAGPSSDVDFLVDMDRGRGLIPFGALRVSLKELLGREVDLATDKTLRPAIRARVLREAITL
ncbi:MAG TPA: nucleotidyltransferase family protein [Gemmatimonadaceae bacterium]|jgi:predicted nucleotidyltransferase|nr:nucleotidyltransferase family protein [Gemmatimonadaceae bacterium]